MPPCHGGETGSIPVTRSKTKDSISNGVFCFVRSNEAHPAAAHTRAIKLYGAVSCTGVIRLVQGYPLHRKRAELSSKNFLFAHNNRLISADFLISLRLALKIYVEKDSIHFFQNLAYL